MLTSRLLGGNMDRFTLFSNEVEGTSWPLGVAYFVPRDPCQLSLKELRMSTTNKEEVTFSTRRASHCGAAVLLMQLSCLAFSACGSTGHGGGGGQFIAAGSLCNAEGVTICGLISASYAVLRCNAGTWKVETTCDPGLSCGYQGTTPVCMGGAPLGDAAIGGADGGSEVHSGNDLDSGESPADLDVQATDDAADASPESDLVSDIDPLPDTGAVDTTAADTELSDSNGPETAADVAECAIAADCLDGDPCTFDSCNAGTCQHVASAPGTECATGKVCDALGACVCANPKKTGPTCSQCIDPSASLPNCVSAGGCWPPTAWNGAALAVSKLTAAPKTEGCDLNLDGKPDNAIAAGLSSLLPSIMDAVDKGLVDGSSAWLLHIPNLAAEPFTLEVMPGKLSGPSGCNTKSMSAMCKYLVDPKAFDIASTDATCPPTIAYPNAKIKGETLTAGGINQVVPVTLMVQGVALNVTLHQATVSAQLMLVGGNLASTGGMNCGVIAQKELIATIDSLPEAALQQVGLDAAAAKALISAVLKADIDMDGDGTKDAYSFAYLWEAVPADIVGIAAP